MSSSPLTVSNGSLAIRGERWASTSQPVRGTVLFLHGGAQTRSSWRNSTETLAAAGWDVITMDLRGHGESDWAPDGDYSTDALVGDLRAVLATLTGAPVLVGASIGGITALVAEAERPGTARALVLVDIAPRIEPAGYTRILTFMTANADGFDTLEQVHGTLAAYMPDRYPTFDEKKLRRSVIQRQDGRWYWLWDPAMTTRTPEELERSLGHNRLMEAARRADLPTLLVRGEKSDVLSPEGAQEFLDVMPDASFYDVRNAGHMLAGDDNHVFTAGLQAFLDDLPQVRHLKPTRDNRLSLHANSTTTTNAQLETD